MNVCFRQTVGENLLTKSPPDIFCLFLFKKKKKKTCLLMRGTKENSGFSGPVGRQASAG